MSRPPSVGRYSITLGASLAIGMRVEITDGLSKGKRGTIVAKWPRAFGGIPQWQIDLGEDQHSRVIRADFLKQVPT